MPKRFKTNKGTRAFPDSLSNTEIETLLEKEGIDAYEPETTMSSRPLDPGEIANKRRVQGENGKKALFDFSTGRFEKSPDSLSPGNAATSFVRPWIDSGVAGTVARAIPHPALKVLGAAAYLGTDQAIQEVQKRAFGQRPMGIAEQVIQPENELAGRLLGTAEEAALTYLPGMAIKGIVNKFKDKVSYNKDPWGHLRNEDVPGEINHEFRPKTGPIDAEWFPVPNIKSTATQIPKNSGMPSGNARTIEATTTPRGTDISARPNVTAVSGRDPKLLNPSTPQIELPGITRQMPPAQMAMELRKANSAIPHYEQILKDPMMTRAAIANKEVHDGMKSYWAAKQMDAAIDPLTGKFSITRIQNSFNDPVTKQLYTPAEINQIRRLFNTVGNNKSQPDMKIGKDGAVMSGLMLNDILSEDQKSQTKEASIGTGLFIGMMLRNRRLGNMMIDYLERGSTSTPLRRFTKYFLRPALAGATAVLHKHDGTSEEVKLE